MPLRHDEIYKFVECTFPTNIGMTNLFDLLNIVKIWDDDRLLFDLKGMSGHLHLQNVHNLCRFVYVCFNSYTQHGILKF